MFDGTDLSLAYGNSFEPAMPSPPPPPMNTSPQQHQPPAMEPVVSRAAASHAQPPDVSYAPPAAMYAKQPGPIAPPEDSMWDRIAAKKWEVIKLVVLSLVVLLGISMDRVVTHYMTNYIGRSFLTDTQEFLVRLAYPVVIVLVMWFIKVAAA